MARHKSVETKYYEDRDGVLQALRNCDRRTFLRISAATMGAVLAKGLMPPHTFQLVRVAGASTAPEIGKGFAGQGASGDRPFTFAYISDAHL